MDALKVALEVTAKELGDRKGVDAKAEKGKKKGDQKKTGKKGDKGPALNPLEQKINNAVKAPKEGKGAAEKKMAERRELQEWTRAVLVDHMVEAAFAYGESLVTCTTIQKKYENRPVMRHVFPMHQAFNFTMQGVLPRSQQSFNALGLMMCLDSENMLNKFDISSNKTV